MDSRLRDPYQGQLIKFTNVVKGWQARWFILDPENGTLQYYLCETDKYERARGSIQLAGAVISPSDEDSLTFSVSPAIGESYKLRAHDTKDRQMWINRLRVVAEMHTRAIAHHNPPLAPREHRARDSSKPVLPPTWAPSGFGGLAVLDAFTQVADILEEAQRQNSALNQAMEELPTNGNGLLSLDSDILVMKATSQATLRCLDQCLVTLKTQHTANCATLHSSNVASKSLFDSPRHRSSPITKVHPSKYANSFSKLSKKQSKGDKEKPKNTYSLKSGSLPPSDCDMQNEGTDAKSTFYVNKVRSVSGESEHSELGSATNDIDSIGGDMILPPSRDSRVRIGSESSYMSSQERVFPPTMLNDEIDTSDSDELRNGSESESEGEDGQRSVIMHIISQLRLGMDLTRVTLPTFILEKRSLLEMFADFLGHPEMFLRISSCTTAKSRLIAVVKWYLTSIHVGRQGSTAKKPYNPIIGEVFKCRWRVPVSSLNETSKSTGSDEGEQYCTINFISEQVSHHPPVSAFFIECPEKQMSVNAHIWTKSKFMGMSVGVNLVGDITLSLGSCSENYYLAIPSAFARSVLTEPWVELGGRINIFCPQTNYTAPITFQTKPFYGGTLHRVVAEVKDDCGAMLCKVSGEWDSVMEFVYSDGSTETLDVRNMPLVCHKRVRPLEKQSVNESRRLWHDVTASLMRGDLETATNHKKALEDDQRKAEAERHAIEAKFPTKLFSTPVQDHWVYNNLPSYASVSCTTSNAQIS